MWSFATQSDPTRLEHPARLDLRVIIGRYNSPDFNDQTEDSKGNGARHRLFCEVSSHLSLHQKRFF